MLDKPPVELNDQFQYALDILDKTKKSEKSCNFSRCW